MRDLMDSICYWMIVKGIAWLSPRGLANMQEELRIIFMGGEDI